MKSYLGLKAENELKGVVEYYDKPVIKEFIPEILALVDKYFKSGQSGMSSELVAKVLSDTVLKLCLGEPIYPILGTDNEWKENKTIFNDDAPQKLFYHDRCLLLSKSVNFKGIEDDRPYYNDAIIFQSENSGFTDSAFLKEKDGTLIEYKSCQYVKSFPFMPKTFYIDVIEENEEYFIKDEEQLKKVFDYYDKL